MTDSGSGARAESDDLTHPGHDLTDSAGDLTHLGADLTDSAHDLTQDRSQEGCKEVVRKGSKEGSRQGSSSRELDAGSPSGGLSTATATATATSLTPQQRNHEAALLAEAEGERSQLVAQLATMGDDRPAGRAQTENAIAVLDQEIDAMKGRLAA